MLYLPDGNPECAGFSAVYNLDRHLSFGVPLVGCSPDKSNDVRVGRLSRDQVRRKRRVCVEYHYHVSCDLVPDCT
jgi:hypothetical protein